MQIIPAVSGLIITTDVVYQTVQVRRAYAEADAVASDADITNMIGRGRVNIRGTITSANLALATLAGTTIEKIMACGWRRCSNRSPGEACGMRWRHC